MEVKKSGKAEIESKRSMWLLLGFISVLSCMFVAFEWTQRDVNIDLSSRPREPVFVEELTPVTFPKENILPPPPAAQIAAEVIKVVDDDQLVKETDVLGTEDDTNRGVVIKPVALSADEDIVEPEADFVIVEEMPTFPGGQQALMQFMARNIKYPTIPQETGIQGKVIVQFVVDKDGAIINPMVVRSIDPYLDKEAIRVIKTMPKWKPGMQRGKAVRVKYTVPVIFKLQ